jgi:nitroimidazol reductase NimA-like FMN-containing flavoprotein (pyridoxamine 5'-phosphate oxidase superfamily)
MVRSIGKGVPVCVTATIVDGLVLARSVFDHSINYRSAVVLGRAVEVTEEAEKMAGFEAVVRHIAPARWEEARRPTADELKQTSVLRLPIEEASAKIRSGPPKDEEEDYALPVWAGVLPLRLAAGEAWDDPELSAGIPRPAWLTSYVRGDDPG